MPFWRSRRAASLCSGCILKRKVFRARYRKEDVERFARAFGVLLESTHAEAELARLPEPYANAIAQTADAAGDIETVEQIEVAVRSQQFELFETARFEDQSPEWGPDD